MIAQNSLRFLDKLDIKTEENEFFKNSIYYEFDVGKNFSKNKSSYIHLWK
ncbi:hypothetical protein LEP1GSC008_1920 [Leptospira kirschneri serovar Bulgarica str. Nikolaevo]|uniref:Uncharacterized protein n=1 Tax=Leptospira kirschneri serovar Bulgarica str. Nikolaevo TaxID=1240687 RepID=M6F7J6_9LEPT|nr:hypothetical protein LEP1GSC008_1920 [Leptospira kirschneri serovar Bulgarica str. Nikolaevo]